LNSDRGNLFVEYCITALSVCTGFEPQYDRIST